MASPSTMLACHVRVRSDHLPERLSGSVSGVRAGTDAVHRPRPCEPFWTAFGHLAVASGLCQDFEAFWQGTIKTNIAFK
jgi:hypothetical protein